MKWNFVWAKKGSDATAYCMTDKAPTVAITQKVFNQICTYNMLLHVDYLMVSNGLQHYCCRMDYEKGTYTFIDGIPEYGELIPR